MESESHSLPNGSVEPLNVKTNTSNFEESIKDISLVNVHSYAATGKWVQDLSLVQVLLCSSVSYGDNDRL
jgi:hypothetical protein